MPASREKLIEWNIWTHSFSSSWCPSDVYTGRLLLGMAFPCAARERLAGIPITIKFLKISSQWKSRTSPYMGLHIISCLNLWHITTCMGFLFISFLSIASFRVEKASKTIQSSTAKSPTKSCPNAAKCSRRTPERISFLPRSWGNNGCQSWVTEININERSPVSHCKTSLEIQSYFPH